MKSINPDIFKAYDIRGKYPEEINEHVASKIGEALVLFARKKIKNKRMKIVLCRDVRISSRVLSDAATKGVLSAGGNVYDAGLATTPFFNYVVETIKPDAGIMVTASHNGPEYNGFKLRGPGGAAIYAGAGLGNIRESIMRKSVLPKSAGFGQILHEKKDLRAQYIRFLTREIHIGKIKTVIDAAGGSAGYFLGVLLRQFPSISYKPIFFEADGTFAEHSPNPLEEQAQEFVQKELLRGGYQFGAVFDADGDRVVFFDEKGERVPSEFVAVLFAEEELKKKPGATFVFPVNTSRGAREYIKKQGGKIKLSRIGYTFVQNAMHAVRAPLGVEVSGHFHFKKFFFRDSALMAWLRLASILSRSSMPFSTRVAPLARYLSSGELNFSITDKDKEHILGRIVAKYQNAQGVKITTRDGVSIEFRDWWCNVRLSNTEPLLRLVLEAKTAELLREKIEEVKAIIQKG